jgi:hypothetical protein
MLGNLALFTQHIPALQRRALENFRYVTLRERFSVTEGSLNSGVEMLRGVHPEPGEILRFAQNNMAEGSA